MMDDTAVAPSKRVFVSYAHDDTAFVDRLAGDLDANSIDTWRDTKAIVPGESITRSIEGALANCTALLLILSPKSVLSSWVDREYRAAVTLQGGDPSGRPALIPCIAETCDVPVFLRDILFADFRKSYEEGFLALARALQITTPRIPTVRLASDTRALLRRVESSFGALVGNRNFVPSRASSEEWSAIEDELLRLLRIDASFRSSKRLKPGWWTIPGVTDVDGAPMLYDEDYPRNAFLVEIARTAQSAILLAHRFGNRTALTHELLYLFYKLDGT